MIKNNCNNVDLVSGKLVNSTNGLERLENFIQRWSNKSEEIKRKSLSNQQAYHIANDYTKEFYMKFFYKDSIKNKILIIEQLANDLMHALFEANNNYKKENRTFWSLFWKDKLKLPDLHIHNK